MSLPWRDEIRIAIAPRQVTLTRMGRGIRRRPLAHAQRRVENGSLGDWRPALDVLHADLGDACWQKADVHVVLSDHWARYAIVPWSSDITNEEERLIQARICLGNVYGMVSDGWTVRVSFAAPGTASVACAVPEALLSDVRSALDAHGLPLVAAQPHLIGAHNAWRHGLPDANGWFVVLDEGTLTAARLVSGGWDRVYSARIGTDWIVELQRLATFGRLAAQDGANSRVYVDAPSWLRELAGDCGAGIEWLAEETIEVKRGVSPFARRRLRA